MKYRNIQRCKYINIGIRKSQAAKKAGFVGFLHEGERKKKRVISRVLSQALLPGAIIYLGRPLLVDSSDLPENTTSWATWQE